MIFNIVTFYFKKPLPQSITTAKTIPPRFLFGGNPSKLYAPITPKTKHVASEPISIYLLLVATIFLTMVGANGTPSIINYKQKRLKNKTHDLREKAFRSAAVALTF